MKYPESNLVVARDWDSLLTAMGLLVGIMEMFWN